MLKKEGEVLLRVTVLKDGSVADIRVLLESPQDFGFGDAAIQYLRQCRWVPAMKDGEAIDSYYNFSFRFTLSQ